MPPVIDVDGSDVAPVYAYKSISTFEVEILDLIGTKVKKRLRAWDALRWCNRRCPVRRGL